MTTSIAASGLSNYGLLGQLGYGSEQIAQTSAGLTQQASDGLISDNVGRLGTATSVVLNLQPQLAQIGAWSTNASIATVRLSAASTALTQLGGMAQSLVDGLLSLRGESGTAATTSLATMASSARGTLGEISSLLNTQVAGSYVFAGGDGSEAPVADPAGMTTGTLYGAARAALNGLDVNGGAATLQTILAASGSTVAGATPFAASGSATSQNVAVGTGVQVATSVPLAAAQGAAASATSTGSSVRDLVAALTTVANLDVTDLNSDQADGLLAGLSSIASSAESGLTQQTAENGASQDLVTSVSNQESVTASLITTQIGDLTSVDAASVAAKLSASNDQLQASYMLISDLKSLDLANYL